MFSNRALQLRLHNKLYSGISRYAQLPTILNTLLIRRRESLGITDTFGVERRSIAR